MGDWREPATEISSHPTEFISSGLFGDSCRLPRALNRKKNVTAELPGGLPFCRDREACVSVTLHICWWEHCLLVGPPRPERSKGRGQTKCDTHWRSRLEGMHRVNELVLQKDQSYGN